MFVLYIFKFSIMMVWQSDGHTSSILHCINLISFITWWNKQCTVNITSWQSILYDSTLIYHFLTKRWPASFSRDTFSHDRLIVKHNTNHNPLNYTLLLLQAQAQAQVQGEGKALTQRLMLQVLRINPLDTLPSLPWSVPFTGPPPLAVNPSSM